MTQSLLEDALREEHDSPIKVLVVDDDEIGAETTVDMLGEAGIEAEMATSALEGLRVLNQGDCDIECVVSDYRMPEMDGLDLLRTIQRIQAEIPVIFFTGHGGESVASEAMSHGLTDYILKQSSDSYELLSSRIANIVERRREVEALWQSQRQFKRLVLSIEEYAIVLLDECGALKTWNPGAERLTGYSEEDVLGRHASSMYSGEDAERFRAILQAVKERGESTTTELSRDRKNGSEFWARESISPVYDKNGEFKGYSQVTQELPRRARQVVRETESPLAEAEAAHNPTLHVESSVEEEEPMEYPNEEAGPLALVRAINARDELGESVE